jgi:hypothetical protein
MSMELKFFFACVMQVLKKAFSSFEVLGGWMLKVAGKDAAGRGGVRAACDCAVLGAANKGSIALLKR